MKFYIPRKKLLKIEGEYEGEMTRKLKYGKGVKQRSAGAAVEALCTDKHYGDKVVYRRLEQGSPACYGELSPPLDTRLQAALRNLRINALYSHQAEALEYVRGGDNLIVATPTASGKTLIYNLPCVRNMSFRSGMPGALYLSAQGVGTGSEKKDR